MTFLICKGCMWLCCCWFSSWWQQSHHFCCCYVSSLLVLFVLWLSSLLMIVHVVVDLCIGDMVLHGTDRISHTLVIYTSTCRVESFGLEWLFVENPWVYYSYRGVHVLISLFICGDVTICCLLVLGSQTCTIHYQYKCASLWRHTRLWCQTLPLMTRRSLGVSTTPQNAQSWQDRAVKKVKSLYSNPKHSTMWK